jgi:hypothetical protein
MYILYLIYGNETNFFSFFDKVRLLLCEIQTHLKFSIQFAAIFVIFLYQLIRRDARAESILWFIKYQTFLRSYDWAPRPPCEHVFSFSVFLCVTDEACWRGRTGGCGGGAKSWDRRGEAWPSVNHSILSAAYGRVFILPDTNVYKYMLLTKIIFYSAMWIYFSLVCSKHFKVVGKKCNS